jgi:hypothetical protein
MGSGLDDSATRGLYAGPTAALLTDAVRGIASGKHDMPLWLLLLIGIASMLAGAVAGSAGARWISN